MKNLKFVVLSAFYWLFSYKKYVSLNKKDILYNAAITCMEMYKNGEMYFHKKDGEMDNDLYNIEEAIYKGHIENLKFPKLYQKDFYLSHMHYSSDFFTEITDCYFNKQRAFYALRSSHVQRALDIFKNIIRHKGEFIDD